MEKIRCHSCRLLFSWSRPYQNIRGCRLLAVTSDAVDQKRGISHSRYPLFKFKKTGFGKGPEARINASLDEKTVDHLKENDLKLKQHPGAFRLSKVTLPEKFLKAVKLISSHENVPEIIKNSQKLRNCLWSRRLPVENTHYKEKLERVESQVRLKEEALLPFLSEKETADFEKKRHLEILKKMKNAVYHWEPIRYSRMTCFEYLFGRTASEYASLCRIFNEIAKRDPEFKPTTLCDYGSGLCTVSWAARQYWSGSLAEHLCADISQEMNQLAELLLRGGSNTNDHSIPSLFFRSHLPESFKIRYDIVVSAYSLMELPSSRARLETIDKLWNKTEHYLVLVESGTSAGFAVVQEARDYILGLGSKDGKRTKCYVFSPCQHNQPCPRFSFDTIPCNFDIKYRPIYPFHQDNCERDLFTYVVLRRGYETEEEKWPRLIEEPMIRSGHVICRLCTKNGNLKELILSRARHSLTYRVLAKRSGWGDLLPIHIEEDKAPVHQHNEDEIIAPDIEEKLN